MGFVDDDSEPEVHPHVNASDWRVYGRGPIYMSVCTRLSFHDAENRINKEEPPQIGHWQYAVNEPFIQSVPNACPCPGRPNTHRHLLFKLL